MVNYRSLIAALLGAVAFAAAASGATFIVTTTADDNGPCLPGDCALREAILAANALPGMDTVNVPAGEYVLSLPGAGSTAGDLDVLDSIELVGVPGETIIRGSSDRVFLIQGVLNVQTLSVSLSGLQITSGEADLGAGIFASVAEIVLSDCWITNNIAEFDGGGVMYGIGGLVLERTTISDNEAGRFGGGIRRLSAASPTSLVLRNSTVAGNMAGDQGGALYSSGSGGQMEFVNSTVVGNVAVNQGSLLFLSNSIGPTFFNSILENDCFFVGSALPASIGGNVGFNASFCSLDQPTDQDGVADLGLMPLALYGGPTPTHAPIAGSPAVDGGLLAGCSPEDQRGESRPVDGDFDGQADCDVGSVELQLPQTPVAVPGLSWVGLVVFVLLLGIAAVRRA